MACACVDIGTNTTRLLIAECDGGHIRELASERVFTLLGQGFSESGKIAEGKLAETAAVVARQVRAAREHGVESIAVVATAAVRHASNGPQLLAAISAETAIATHVLSEAEECRLAFLGATAMMDPPPAGRLLVIDVGGGSTEVVLGTVDGGVSSARSLAIGSGSLTDRHFASDPPAEHELAAAREQAANALGSVGSLTADAAFACGGSAGSLERLTGSELAHETLKRALTALCAAPAEVVAERLALDPRRVRLLPAAVVILESICGRLPSALTIGRGGVREGVIIELARGSC
ncbi:MAG: Ppx/GppA phosphatase family protein [Thermoleophilaceae bacterium]